VRRGDFPPLRDTAAWEEAQEARRTKILAAVVLGLGVIARGDRPRATATGEEIEQLPAAMLDTGAQR